MDTESTTMAVGPRARETRVGDRGRGLRLENEKNAAPEPASPPSGRAPLTADHRIQI